METPAKYIFITHTIQHCVSLTVGTQQMFDEWMDGMGVFR